MSDQVTQGYPSSTLKATILENKVVANVTHSDIKVLNKSNQNITYSNISLNSASRTSFPLFKWVYNPSGSTNSILLTSGSQTDQIDYNDLPAYDSVTQPGHGTITANITPQSLNFQAQSSILSDVGVVSDLTLYVYEDIEINLNWSNFQNRTGSLQIVQVNQSGTLLNLIFSSDALNGSATSILNKNEYYRIITSYSANNNNISSTLSINLNGIHNIGSFELPIATILKVTDKKISVQT